MNECPYFEHLLVIPRLRIQNANAISSPLTHGFPSITAFMGLMWALERQACAVGLDLQFNAVGVIAHDFEEQTTDGGYVSTFRLTRNPIGKDGKTAAIVEEGRIHLDLSLIFAVQSQALNDAECAREAAQQVRDLIAGMRVAGGTVVASTSNTAGQSPYVIAQTGDDNGRDKLFQQHKMCLLPGFALVERQDLLEQRYQELCEKDPRSSRLDAWLSLSRFNYSWQVDAEKGTGEWQHDRKGRGWLVPIPVGYGALTDLQSAGSIANARDATTPFRFVESLYGIGQWLSPHRLQSPQQMLWYPDSTSGSGHYRCRNDYGIKSHLEYDFD